MVKDERRMWYTVRTCVSSPGLLRDKVCVDARGLERGGNDRRGVRRDGAPVAARLRACVGRAILACSNVDAGKVQCGVAEEPGHHRRVACKRRAALRTADLDIHNRGAVQVGIDRRYLRQGNGPGANCSREDPAAANGHVGSGDFAADGDGGDFGGGESAVDLGGSVQQHAGEGRSGGA